MATTTKALRIVLPGGTGQSASILARHLSGRGHMTSTVLSRGMEPIGAQEDWVSLANRSLGRGKPGRMG